MNPLRVIFMGTAPLAAVSLKALLTSPGLMVVAVVTQPDRPKGRDLKLQPSAVKLVALEYNLPVLQPERARHPDFIEQLRALHPDLIVVAAYGQILPSAILDLPPYGCLNVHTSLLPKYRGAAPIQWAILNGDAETGVTIMKMDPGLDTGGIVSIVRTPVSPEDTAETLHDRLAILGAKLLLETIPDYVAGKLPPQPQPKEGASIVKKITKEDGLLDWRLPAVTLWNRVRGLTPWPGAYTFIPAQPKARLLKVWQVRPEAASTGQPGEVLAADRQGIVVCCGEGALRLMELQREGARRMSAADFLAGCPLPPGTVLGAAPVGE